MLLITEREIMMSAFKIEVDFNEIVEDMFYDAGVESDEFGSQAVPTKSFSDAVRESVINDVSRVIKSKISDDAIKSAQMKSREVADEFIEKELGAIITHKLLSGEVKTKYNGVKTIDELIEDHLSASRIQKVLENHINKKAEEFAKDLKARYDNIFAAKIVSSLSKQKMLSPEVSKLLLGDDQ